MERLLHAMPFALAHYAAITGFGALSYAVGRKITGKGQFHSGWERAAVCMSLGLGAIAYVVFAVCLAHVLYPITLLAILGIAAIVCVPELRSLVKEVTASLNMRRKPGRLLAMGVGGLVLFLPYALLGLYPPQGETSFDALWYHLAVAKLYVQHNGFLFAPYAHLSLFPQLNEMLFTLMLTLLDDVAAALVSTLVLAVLIIAVCAWGYRLYSKAVGYWGFAVLLGIPMVVWAGSNAYVDITVTLFGTMALYSCWNWLQERAQQWLVLTAVFAGFAAGTKYSGLFFVCLTALIVVFYGVRHRQYAAVVLFVAIAAGITAPWYARNIYYTGNPVFPFLSAIFGHGFYSAEEAAMSVDETRVPGVGRSLAAFVSLPWQLAFHPTVFRAESGVQGPKKFFLLLPLAVPFALTDRRIGFLCGVAFSYVTFWFFATQDLRYLLPAFPVLGLSIAAAMYSILEWQPLVRRWARSGIIVGIICIVWASSGWRTAVGYLHYYGPLPVTQEERDAYLTRFLPAYPAVKLLNRLKGRNYTLFPIGALPMAYFADGKFLGEAYGTSRLAGILAQRGDNRGFYRELQSLGADYLLLVRGRHELRQDGFFQDHFKPIYARPPVELYEITGTHEAR